MHPLLIVISSNLCLHLVVISLSFPLIFLALFLQFFANQDGVEPDKAPTSERSLKSRAILARQVNGIVADQVTSNFCW